MRNQLVIISVVTMPFVFATKAYSDRIVEHISPKEEASTRRTAELLEANLKSEEIKDRDFHIKQHGCLEATFTVSDKIDKKFQHGVFAQPGREYPVWIRYSNGRPPNKRGSDPQITPDTKGDARGFALKLMGVEGERLLPDDEIQTQDFLMVNVPAFFMKGPEHYADFVSAANSGSVLQLGKFFLFGPWGERATQAYRMWEGLTKIENPVEPRYFSQTPYRLSDSEETRNFKRVKYSVNPIGTDWPSVEEKGPDFLREALGKTLAAGPVELEFKMQIGTPDMATEDASTLWDERKAPFEVVAHIHIPSQNFDTPEQHLFCKNMSFSPWHGIHPHQPLGGINRAREEVYRTISEYRRKNTGSAGFEPLPGMKPEKKAGIVTVQ